MKQTDTHLRYIEAAIHIIGWGIVFGFPYLMMSRSGVNLTWGEYLRHGSIVPLTFLIVFYANYLFLIPRYLFGGRTKEYILINILLIACLAFGSHLWQEYTFRHQPPGRPGQPFHIGPPKWLFLLRDAFSMVLTVGLSTAIRLSKRWTQIEDARREAEKSRTEAELKNLRSQLNPHFLLNTLNNIYALIAFDADKAQAAVQELSCLLRHVLYENQQQTVTLDKEMDFNRNYIELMRIRLAKNVSVETRFDIPPDSRTPIAPLIFISLIENAFKHGISPTEPSFIRILFSEKAASAWSRSGNGWNCPTPADTPGGRASVRTRKNIVPY